MKPSFKIDVHAHIMPSDWPSLKDRYGYDGFIQLKHISDNEVDMIRDDGKFFRKVQKNCYDPESIISDMDFNKVNVMILCTIPVLFNYWAKPEHGLDWSQFLNDHLAGVQNKYPKRLIGLGTLPMQSVKDAIREMERCKFALGLKGIEIGSNINQKNLDHPDFYPFWEAAESLQMPILIHPWQMMGQELTPDYFLPWLVGMPAETSRAMASIIFGGIYERFPKVKIMFSHAGGSLVSTIGRWDHGFQARPDLCQIHIKNKPSSYLKHVWVDSITHDPLALSALIQLLGPDKIAYGTDYPFPLGDLEHGKMIMEMKDISDAIKEKLFWKNAFNFFGLSPAEYMSAFL